MQSVYLALEFSIFTKSKPVDDNTYNGIRDNCATKKKERESNINK